MYPGFQSHPRLLCNLELHWTLGFLLHHDRSRRCVFPMGNIRGRAVGAYQTANSFIDYYQQDKQVYYGVLEADLTDSTLFTLGVDYQKYSPQGVSYGSFPMFYSDGSQTDFFRSFNPGATATRTR